MCLANVNANGSHTTYAYDAKSRLTQDETTGTNAHTYDYSYDSRDNRLTSNEAGTSTFMYNAGNQITTSASFVLGPTAETTTYTYDSDGNMTVVVEEGSDPVTMGYDMENRMVTRKDGASIVTYTYGDEQRLTEVDADGSHKT